MRFIWMLVIFACGYGVLETKASPEIIAPLIDPVKLDALRGDRAANSRLRKIAYWLEADRRAGADPREVIKAAQKSLGYHGTPRAEAVVESLLRNLTILERLGCLNDEGMIKLRKGNAPTITLGPYTGDIASVDHIIPRSIAPGLDERLYNLEFMPSRLNMRKGALIGQRQVALAKAWYRSDLILESEYKKVMALAPRNSPSTSVK